MEWGLILLGIVAIAIAVVAVIFIRRAWIFVVGFVTRFIWWFILGLLIVVLIIWAGSCASSWISSSDEDEEAQVEEVSPSPTPAGQQEQQVVERKKILRFEGFTPCEPRIDFAFELVSTGPIMMDFPGVSEPVEYSGQGHLGAPADRKSGPVPITSQDPDEQIRIKIWEIF